MPPITPEQYAVISHKLEKLTLDFEENIIADIARKIKAIGSIDDSSEQQLIILKELGYSTEFLEKEIAKYLGKSSEEVAKIFFETGQYSDEFYEKVYKATSREYTPVHENALLSQLLNAGIRQTNNELKNFTRSMGFLFKDESGKTHFTPTAKAYQELLNLVHTQVSTGLVDYGTAIRYATKKLCDSGLRFVDYDSGVKNHADVAVRRALLTGVSQFTGAISTENAATLETDIVEVTAHAGARPDHASWQGGWYSLSGKSDKYKSLIDATGYGTGAGLKGWNCRHDFYPVIPDVDEPTYTKEELENIDPPPITWNGKELTYYECTQKQREMERAMRKSKRVLIGAKESGDSDSFTAASIKLGRQKERYKEFSNKANLLTRDERIQVYGFDRSIASKAAWAYRKSDKTVLTGGTNGDIMEGKK